MDPPVSDAEIRDSGILDSGSDATTAESVLIEDWEDTSVFLWQRRQTAPDFAGVSGTILPSPREQSQKALHIVELAKGDPVHVRGHGHVRLPADASVRFWARTGLPNPERLRFAVTGNEGGSLSEAHSHGRTWLGTELVVTPAWRQIEVKLTELKPIGDGVSAPLWSDNVVMLHFMTLPETADFWIDDVELFCPSGC